MEPQAGQGKSEITKQFLISKTGEDLYSRKLQQVQNEGGKLLGQNLTVNRRVRLEARRTTNFSSLELNL